MEHPLLFVLGLVLIAAAALLAAGLLIGLRSERGDPHCAGALGCGATAAIATIAVVAIGGLLFLTASFSDNLGR